MHNAKASLGLLIVLATPAVGQGAPAELATAAHPEEGEYLIAPNGYALYLFKADRQGVGGQAPASVCEGDCLATWPAFLVDNAAPAVAGTVDARLLGTMTSSDGTVQVTYNGWPLYFYAEDIQPGDINGHDIESFGEDWYLIGPSGTRARD